jgi:hypothetical protein
MSDDLTIKALPRCEGMRRYGGAFTFGLPRWEQCREMATVELWVVQKGSLASFPACHKCWEEAIEWEMDIKEVKPL